MQPQGGGKKEALNPAEVERLMAREGYTNGCGLSNKSRLEVLGESWHLPTINCGAPAAIGRAVRL